MKACKSPAFCEMFGLWHSLFAQMLDLCSFAFKVMLIGYRCDITLTICIKEIFSTRIVGFNNFISILLFSVFSVYAL